jgi:hypothetical protein
MTGGANPDTASDRPPDERGYPTWRFSRVNWLVSLKLSGDWASGVLQKLNPPL